MISIRKTGQCSLSSTVLCFSLLLLILTATPRVSAKFYEPSSTEREVWKVGEVHKIPYDTKITNYSIAIWQILDGGDKGRMGPVLVRNENGPETVSEFEWTVQLYRFNLTLSNYFYFLLREGGPDNQSNASARFVSSPYFNISDDTVASSSTTTSTATSTTLSTSSSDTPPAVGQAPGDTETPPPGSTTSSGLSVGAQAGIGVGVSIVGIIVIFCAILWYRYIKKKRDVLADLQKRATMSQPPDHDGSNPYATHTIYSSEGSSPWKAQYAPLAKVPQSPSELPTAPHPVEMPT